MQHDAVNHIKKQLIKVLEVFFVIIFLRKSKKNEQKLHFLNFKKAINYQLSVPNDPFLRFVNTPHVAFYFQANTSLFPSPTHLHIRGMSVYSIVKKSLKLQTLRICNTPGRRHLV